MKMPDWYKYNFVAIVTLRRMFKYVEEGNGEKKLAYIKNLYLVKTPTSHLYWEPMNDPSS